MHIVRYAPRADAGAPGLGVRRDGWIAPMPGIGRLADLLRLPAAEIRARVEQADAPALSEDSVVLLPPADGRMEVWACGVTYERSKEARIEESSQACVYRLVYHAERPELFFKSVPWRLVTDGEPIGIRADSDVDVPEPELAVVVNAHAEIVGYTVCNDVSSRAIEGANPLYLPQAKIYAGSCSLAAGIRPAWAVADHHQLDVAVSVRRDGHVVWDGSTSTRCMRRRIDELVACLFREQDFPHGAVLATGTGLVPDLEFTLRPGDRVRISISEVGTLDNAVVEGAAAMRWLVDARDDALLREKVR